MPIAWDELPRVSAGDHWNIATAIGHLSGLSADPWADYWSARQDLQPAMDRLGFTPRAAAAPAKARRTPRRKLA
jgi:bifunctional non-homologous end joining protein LigD